jgi:hypothetical protein
MNMTKAVTLTIVGIITIAIMLTIIQLLLRKVKPQAEADFKIKPAYGTWFAGLFVAAAQISFKAVTFLSEAIDNIYKIGSPAMVAEVAKIAALYIGLGVVWFLLWYFVSKVFTTIILGLKKDQEEMSLNNVHFFLIKGTIINVFIFSLSPVLDVIFRMVMPNIQLPFYH